MYLDDEAAIGIYSSSLGRLARVGKVGWQATELLSS